MVSLRIVVTISGGRDFMRIAIIHHEREKPEGLSRFLISALEEKWRDRGHSVIHLFGPDRYAEADLALVHVDLSVVPESYLQLARRYPLALNPGVTDIRKSHWSQNLLTQEDDFQGPVIVKSDLNHGGLPERYVKGGRRRWSRLLFWKKKPLDYLIYPSAAKVPPALWSDPSRVVEKFLPEFEAGFYFIRQTYFLGEQECSWRLRSADSIIRGNSYVDDVEIPTPVEIGNFRRAAGLDYGKIDFVEHEGRIVILDVNKTIGNSAEPMITTDRLAPAIEAFQTVRNPL